MSGLPREGPVNVLEEGAATLEVSSLTVASSQSPPSRPRSDMRAVSFAGRLC